MGNIVDEARKSIVIKVIIITAVAVLGFIAIGYLLMSKGLL